MTGLGVAVALLLLLWLSLLYVRFRWRPIGIYLFVPKVLAVALLPFIAAVGAWVAMVGGLFGSWWVAVPAGIAAVGALVVMVRLGSVRADVSGALGVDWMDRIPPERRPSMVSRWWSGPLPRIPEPRLRQDVPFATVPGADRVLLCDVWQPPVGVHPSGLAVVFLHASAYYIFDKDFLTRPLFRHLAAQGHVIVDVAYRLFPETGVVGMVGDAKRAVGWVRQHAADLDIDPERIVLVGGSAGGHLSLLSAYAQDDSPLTPRELAGADLRVCAVASLYGQVGLETLYERVGQDRVCHPDDPQPEWAAPPSRALVRVFGDDATRLRLAFVAYGGRCDWLMGGTPSEVPARYAQLVSSQLFRSRLSSDTAHARDARRDGAGQRRQAPAGAARRSGCSRDGRLPAARRPHVRRGDQVVARSPGRRPRQRFLAVVSLSETTFRATPRA